MPGLYYVQPFNVIKFLSQNGQIEGQQRIFFVKIPQNCHAHMQTWPICLPEICTFTYKYVVFVILCKILTDVHIYSTWVVF